jgi:excisionase family DNA binding protein
MPLNGSQTLADAVPQSAVRTHEPERLLTADELADRWQVPKAQVYRVTREGHLPAVRIGRYYRYRVAVVEVWECEGGVGSE